MASHLICEIAGCYNPVLAKCLCSNHYQYLRYHGTLEPKYHCQGCRVLITGAKRKYCTTKCGETHRRRLRGIANILDVREHRRNEATQECIACGDKFLRASGRAQRFCSRSCFHEFEKLKRTAGRLSHTVKRWRCQTCNEWMPYDSQIAALYCGEKCKVEKNFAPKAYECGECGASFVPEYGDRRRSYCSDSCSKKNNRRVRRKKERALLRSVKAENVNPIKVFERDGWICHLCGKPTLKSKRGTYHKRAPELDHITPLSKGGDHSYANTACSCRSCNASKSDTIAGQPSLLPI